MNASKKQKTSPFCGPVALFTYNYTLNLDPHPDPAPSQVSPNSSLATETNMMISVADVTFEDEKAHA
jgi:hypothetical protein